MQKSSFQSTLPAREATNPYNAYNNDKHNFNPRFPRGKRRYPPLFTDRECRFQSTLPAREATWVKEKILIKKIKISIHASREGSDVIRLCTWLEYLDFNPRFPRGKRHATDVTGVDNTPISIHASREGSDGPPFGVWLSLADFNPRFPRGKRPLYR